MQLSQDKQRLISRYLNGYCSAEEQKVLLDWVQQSEENKKHFFRLKDVWDAGQKREDLSEKKLFHFYQSQLKNKAALQKSLRVWRFVAGFAAVFVLGLIFTVLFVSLQKKESQLVVHTVPLGSKSKVILADGTEVHLNSGSRLEYFSGFSGGNREVHLTGEAFFRVKSDCDHPFTVATSDFDIAVTGTEFNVCTYDDNSFSSVSLMEGEISLSFPNIHPIGLDPGEKIRFSRNERQYAFVAFDLQAEIAWKEGQFIFQDISFPELIKRLERWYDVKLICRSNKLNSFKYSGSFKNQETIWQVLDALELTTPIEYSRKGFREFVISYKPVK